MKLFRWTFLVTVTVVCGGALASSPSRAETSESPWKLWYDRPAATWTEALPVGNGRLGAMVFGGIQTERVQLNEGTLWAGGPYDPVSPEAGEALPHARQLVREGKYAEAAKWISAKVMARPLGQMPYQTLGSLRLTFPADAPSADYRRELDLETAIASVRLGPAGNRCVREIFASVPDQVIAVHLTAERPGTLAFTAGFETPMQATPATVGNDTLVLRGRGGDVSGIPGQIQFHARVRILARGGQTTATSNQVAVAGADEALLLIAAGTNFRRFDTLGGDPEAEVTQRLAAAAAKDWKTLRSAHLADYQTLYRRVTLDLGQNAEAQQKPTPQRIRQFAEGRDPQLAALYYQYGRYLLISCSRPGGQPAPLQGLWNDSPNPPWGGKNTININTEMNYWPAESGQLAECVSPLVDMVAELAVTGARTAKRMYGARGWVVHHNTDLWRATAPIDGPDWGMWPMGGAWLCLHLWDRFEFGGDRAYLARIYPLLKGATEFFLDTLEEEPQHHWLVTNPSISPENGHPFGSAVCAGPTMDQQILRDLFAHTVRAAELLAVDPGFRQQVTATRARLAPNQIGSSGQLQEWLADWDLQAGDRHHRHVSHLYGLFPGRDISRRGTPDLAAAVKKSLELRGDRATGWATAWRLCLWAHLGEGDHAFEILKFLLSPERTYPNMFDAHPPFQIDGNFGGAAGLVEMLMQSRIDEIELLPALPSAWPDGRVRGLRARGGFEVDLTWEQGRLREARVRALAGGTTRLRYAAQTRDVRLAQDETLTWNGQ